MTSLPEKIYFLFNTFCTFLFEAIFALFHQSRAIFIKRLALQLARKNVLYVKLFQAIAMNKNLSVDILEVLSKDKSARVRQGVAMHSNSDAQILEQLASDKDESVRNYVAINPNTPITVLKEFVGF